MYEHDSDVEKGSGDRYLNHLYTNKKWHVKQERIQMAEQSLWPKKRREDFLILKKHLSRPITPMKRYDM